MSLPVLFLLAGPLVTAQVPDTRPAPQKTHKHILFVGNSLTAANDLPRIVEQLARLTPLEIDTAVVAAPGASLEDHWAGGRIQPALKGQRWDLVILQQGPSALPESRLHLIRWTAFYAKEIRASGGTPALLMVWPGRENAGAWDDVTRSYQTAARQNGAALFPVGEAFRRAATTFPAASLYADDGFHPSAKGSVLAAFVMLKILCACEFALPSYLQLPDGRIVRFDTSELAALTEAADWSIRRFAQQ